MTQKVLLPAGMHDRLTPEADNEHEVTNQLLKVFKSNGYAMVSPSLMEFEDSLFAGSGKEMTAKTFRVMDPISQNMMGVRADMTVQVARIASSTLAKQPLPLRFSYAGQVLRVKGTDVYGERQLTQAGIELIGVDSLAADTEVLRVALESLENIGIKGLSVDFSMPRLAKYLLDSLSLSPSDRDALEEAIRQKEYAVIESMLAEDKPTWLSLLHPATDIKDVLAVIASLDVPEQISGLCKRLAELTNNISNLFNKVNVTYDIFENCQFEYHTGIGFAIFSSDSKVELGRGGHYHITVGKDELGAIGFSVYVNDILRILPDQKQAKRVYIPFGTDISVTQKAQREGAITIHGLEDVADVEAEAKRLGCEEIVG